MLKIHTFTFNPYRENTYVLFDETNECVIIDPGCNNAAEQNKLTAFITDNKLRPVLLLNTHCHIDHVLGNKFVFDNYGLKPHFHEGEEPILNAVVSYAPAMGIPYEVSPPAELYLADNERIFFGKTELLCLLCPGHSPASLVFYNELSGVVIGGDVLFYESVGRYDLPGGDMQTLKDSIMNRLMPLPDETVVYPGHGPATTIGHERKYNPFL